MKFKISKCACSQNVTIFPQISELFLLLLQDLSILCGYFFLFQWQLQWENGQKFVYCNKIQQECTTTIQSSLLSYVFIVLFRDTPLATIGRTWPDGHMAINGHFSHIWPLKSKNFTDSGRSGRRTKTKTVLKSGNKMEYFETMSVKVEIPIAKNVFVSIFKNVCGSNCKNVVVSIFRKVFVSN